MTRTTYTGKHNSFISSSGGLLAALTALSLFPGHGVMAAVSVSVDLSADGTTISPFIYGFNDWQRDSVTASMNFSLERMGGNRTTGYNWENNASNAGSDYIHHSDNYLVNSVSASLQNVPGEAVILSVDHARSLGHDSLVTLQLAGYVAADKNGTVTEAQAAPSSRWKQVKITKGSTLSTSPDTLDDYVYLDEQVNFLISKYGKADAGGVTAYSMDNEPALWSSTHARLHPSAASVSEIISQNAAAAEMVKKLDASAQVYGPALYGWKAYETFQDATDWTTSLDNTYEWFVSYYLSQMKARADSVGFRLLDVLDVHYYPEATGINDSGEETRITTNEDNSAGVVDARLQAPRSLWDETYTETSWISTWMTKGPLKLLPRLQSSIDTYYPGTGIGITEYDFGGHYNYSGGIAMADVLGIFGKYGVYAACYWGEAVGYIPPAFRLYRNYDGENSTFGDISLPATNSDAVNYSAYASKDADTGSLHLILINKTASVQSATVTLANADGRYENASVYGFDETNSSKIVTYDTVTGIEDGSFSYNLPAHSALHFVMAGNTPATPLEIETVDASNLRIRFKTHAGSSYRLQSSTDLKAWSDFGEVYQGDDNVHSLTLTMPAAKTFWRLVTVSQ